MEQQIFHGELKPADVAQALLAEFNRGSYRAQILGQSDNLAVQIGSRPGAAPGGRTAVTVTIQSAPDGVMVCIGQQEWLSVAASLGWTAFAVLRNPFNLLGRLDDLAQDVENLQLSERVWQVIEQSVQAAGASHQLSERLSRITCQYCGTANPIGSASCLACGAPLGKFQPGTCPHCGFVIKSGEIRCPNCGRPLAG